MTDPVEAPAGGYLADAPWTGRRTLVVFLAWIGGSAVGLAIVSAMGGSTMPPATEVAVIIACQSAGALLAVTLLSQSAGTGRLGADVGLMVRGRDLVGLAIGVGLEIAISLLLVGLIEWLDVPDQSQTITGIVQDTPGLAGRVVLALTILVVTPVAEEVIFRGVLLAWLTRRIGGLWAVVASSAVFSVVHYEPGAVLQLVALFPFAVVLAAVALRRGNLGMPIMMHAGFNLLAFVVIVSDLPV
ncbi:MAG TPA: CPBP family intramembrane glutamic endopeptidase [Acidimicrobiia bacterium]